MRYLLTAAALVVAASACGEAGPMGAMDDPGAMPAATVPDPSALSDAEYVKGAWSGPDAEGCVFFASFDGVLGGSGDHATYGRYCTDGSATSYFHAVGAYRVVQPNPNPEMWNVRIVYIDAHASSCAGSVGQALRFTATRMQDSIAFSDGAHTRVLANVAVQAPDGAVTGCFDPNGVFFPRSFSSQ